MRISHLLVCALALAACSDGGAATTTTVPTSTTAAPSTTASTTPPPPCPPAPYEVPVVPASVAEADEAADESEPDEITSIGGTHTRLWVDQQGEPAIALVRGTLPPNQFPAERGEVMIDESRGVAGPYPDGRWLVTWFNEPGERCDQYTMVFYPPVSPQDVEATIQAMERTAG